MKITIESDQQIKSINIEFVGGDPIVMTSSAAPVHTPVHGPQIFEEPMSTGRAFSNLEDITRPVEKPVVPIKEESIQVADEPAVREPFVDESFSNIKV